MDEILLQNNEIYYKGNMNIYITQNRLALPTYFVLYKYLIWIDCE